MAGILAIGVASMAEMLSLRRVHSPASQQRKREQAAKRRAHLGAEQAGLDRIAHHEEPAERQRQPADPHHPAGADRFLEAAVGLRQGRRWCRRRAACGLLRSLRGQGRCDGFGFRSDGRRRRGDACRRRGLRTLERHERRERWRHGHSGGGRCRFERLQTLAQLRHLVHGLTCEDQGGDRNCDRREQNEGIVEHLASRRARQSVNRPRPQPGCNPVCSFVR